MATDLNEQLRAWHDAGLIDADQVAAIRAFERPGDEGIAVWQEAFGYLGGTLVLSAGGLLLGEFWDALTVPGQLTIFAVVAVVLTVIGYLVPADREAAFRRLSSLLLAAGTVATGWLVGFGGTELTSISEEAVVLLASSAGAAHGLVTWRTRVSPLQQIVTFAALSTAIGAAGAALDVRPSALVGGLLVATAGLVWGLLTWGEIVRPRVTGYLLAGAGLGVGLQITSFDDPRALGLALAVLATVGVLAAGARLGELVLLGLGAAGILVFVPQLVFELFADTVGAPLALLVTGAVLIGGAVASIRMGREVLAEEDEQDRRDPAAPGEGGTT